jgi:hypothetical protein
MSGAGRLRIPRVRSADSARGAATGPIAGFALLTTALSIGSEEIADPRGRRVSALAHYSADSRAGNA